MNSNVSMPLVGKSNVARTAQRNASRKAVKKRREIREIPLTDEQRKNAFSTAFEGDRGPHGDRLLPIAIAPNAFSDYGSGLVSWAVGSQLLTEHEERSRKNGPCIIMAAMKGGRENVDAQYTGALAYDIDGKFALEEAVDRLRALKLEAVLFTTFNHGNTVSHSAASTVLRWAEAEGLGVDPTRINETLVRFCASRPKFDHLRNVHALHEGKTVMVRERWGGVESFEFAHDAEPKLRGVFLLREPIRLVGTEGIGSDGFRSVYNAIGDDLWDGRHDKSCSNPARVFFLPSHRASAEFFSAHFVGEPLDWRPYWKPKIKAAAEKRVGTKNCSASSNAPAGIEELVMVLRAIPADVPYEQWFSCLAAIYHETQGAEEGRAVAHTWSSEDPRYDPDQVDEIWDRLRADHQNPATMGSLIHIARQHDPQFRSFSSATPNYQLLR